MPKTINYLGINLIKKVKDLYTENYKTSVKEIEDRNKWKDVSCSWFEENIQMATIPQITCRFKAIPLNVSPAFLLYIDKLIIKVRWK